MKMLQQPHCPHAPFAGTETAHSNAMAKTVNFWIQDVSNGVSSDR